MWIRASFSCELGCIVVQGEENPCLQCYQAQINRQSRQPTPIRGSQLIAVKPYVPQYFDEMALKEGDVIAFMDELEDGWWRGMKLGNPSPVRNCTISFSPLYIYIYAY